MSTVYLYAPYTPIADLDCSKLSLIKHQELCVHVIIETASNISTMNKMVSICMLSPPPG